MRRTGLFAAALSVLALASCVPWTVVPIDEDIGQSESANGKFDAQAYVDSIWESRLLPAARQSVIDLETAQEKYRQGQGMHSLVHGRGRVLRVDTESRSGRLRIDFAPGDGTPDASILIGPVILGTALRDAAGFIEFSQFTNQLDYADVANELNRRVVEDVLGHLDFASLRGKTIAFRGVWSTEADGAIEIVPVTLEVE